MTPFCFITSAVTLQAGEALTVSVRVTDAQKCERCWHYTLDVGADPSFPGACKRCAGNYLANTRPATRHDGKRPFRFKSSARSKALFAWLGLAALLVLLDQASKQWIIQTMAFGDGFEVTGFFNIVRVHNHGAAFSFLAGEDGWQRWFFAGIAVVAAYG